MKKIIANLPKAPKHVNILPENVELEYATSSSTIADIDSNIATDSDATVIVPVKEEGTNGFDLSKQNEVII